MKEIKITQNKVVLVDDSDFEWLNQWKWQWKSGDRSIFGYAHRTQRIKGTKSKLHIKMHRLIMQAKEGQFIDHKNGNGLDNRRSNLRLCTLSQNNQNFPLSISNKSGYKGVSWHKGAKRWRVTIKLEKKQKSLGYYHDLKKAAIAYNKGAKQYFGEFARINTI